MNTTTKITILTLTILGFAGCNSFNEEEKKAKTLELFKDFRGQLQGELMQAVSTKGPENAIDVCSKFSPELETKISKEHGLVLRRVSDLNRNMDHAPDELEAKVIQQWKDDLQKGVQPAVFTQKTEKEFRVLKPILIDNAACLKCHGNEQEINDATKQKLQAVYPNDRAKGYKLGDVRGAFSASWKI